MIQILFYNDGYEINGHAEYDKYGKDIVCAAISAISLGSLNWFNEKDILFCDIDENKPIVKIKLNMNEKNTIALSLIEKQISSIASSYKKYVYFKKNKKNMEV